MLAYYVEWHMRRALRPLLFDDEDPEAAESQRSSVVALAQPSPSARAKAQRKINEQGDPVFSFRGMIGHLATHTRNRIAPKIAGAPPFQQLSRPISTQEKALDLREHRCRPEAG